MRLKRWGAAALALCLCVTGTAKAQQQGGREYQTAGLSGDQNVDLASYNDCNMGCSVESCNSCGDDGGLMGGIMDRPLMLIAGAEYIYARANFSQALSYVANTVPVAGPSVTQFNQYEFDYNSSYGFYGGIADCCCGGALMFNFQRLRSDAAFGPVSDTADTNILVPFEVDPPAGGFTTGFASVDLQSYAATFQKTIPLGSPLCAETCCGCGDTCCGDDCCGDDCCGDDCCGGCNSCSGGWCPAWDLTWRGGIRFADVDWSRGANAFDVISGTSIAEDSYVTNFNFEGFGFTTGLEGRRYFGRKGKFSVFAGGDISVLLGDINITTTVIEGGNTSIFQDSCTHIVPVTEVEMGGTYHIGCHASISAGYFFSAWHDLGMREEYNFATQLSHYDDANILGFDGFFARAEVAF